MPVTVVAPEAKSPDEPKSSKDEAVDISGGMFHPGKKLAPKMKKAGEGGMEVYISCGKKNESYTVRMKQNADGTFASVSPFTIPIALPFLGHLLANLTGSIESSKLTAQVSISDLAKAITEDVGKKQWKGISLETLQEHLECGYNEGVLTFVIKNMNVKIGGFADGTFNASLDKKKNIVVDASAGVKVKGIADAQLNLHADNHGNLSGSASVSASLKSFSGKVTVIYRSDGKIDVEGVLAYAGGDKLSGSVHVMVTDKETADNFTNAHLNAKTTNDIKVPKPGTKPGDRAVVAVGNLGFKLTDWLNGETGVIVDSDSHVTFIGKISTGAKEFQLFPKWEMKPFTIIPPIKVTAAYGVPWVANVHVGASVGLTANAWAGPGVLRNIVVEGTYSTNPNIAKNIAISGSFNLSAAAALVLRAEGLLGVTLLGIDLDGGIGINASAGLKGYVEATPTIGFREPREFYVKGSLDIGMQPFLGLSGDMFARLDTWLLKKEWKRPLFNLEYPVPYEFGLSVDMGEYVIGSGKMPDFKMKPFQFDGSKFLGDISDEKVPGGGGHSSQNKQGAFKDELPPDKAAKAVTKKPQPTQKPEKKEIPSGPGKGLRADAQAAEKSKREKDNTAAAKTHGSPAPAPGKDAAGHPPVKDNRTGTSAPNGKGQPSSQNGSGTDKRTPSQKQIDVDNALKEGTAFLKSGSHTSLVIDHQLLGLKKAHNLSEFRLVVDKHDGGKEIVHLHAAASPGKDGEKVTIDADNRPEQLIGKSTPILDKLVEVESDAAIRYVREFFKDYDGTRYQKPADLVAYVEHRAARKLGRKGEEKSRTKYGDVTGIKNTRKETFKVFDNENLSGSFRVRIPDLFLEDTVVGDIKDVNTISLDEQMRDDVRISGGLFATFYSSGKKVGKTRFDLVVRTNILSEDGKHDVERTHVSGPLKGEIENAGGKILRIIE